MAYWDNLKKTITDVIKTNGNQEITGASLQSVLLNIVANTGANATFAGIATPTVNPGVPDGPVFYIASKAGIYSNFDGIEIQFGEFSILKWETTWKKIRINPFIESSIYADYIQEIYIRGNTEDVGVAILVADNSEIQILLKTKSSNAAYLSEPNGIELGKVYHIPEYGNSGIDAYIVIGKKVKNSSDTVFFNDAAYNIACSPKILEYLSLSSFDFANNFYKISDNKVICSHISNLFVKASQTDNISVGLYKWHKADNSMHLYLFKNGSAFAKLIIGDTTTGLIPGNVYKLNTYDGSEDSVYVVFNNGITDSNIEISNAPLNNSAIRSYSKNPIIEAYMLNALNDYNKKVNKNWTDNDEFNLYIEELFIPELTSRYGNNCSVYRMVSKSTQVQLFLKTESGAFFVVMFKDITDFYYKSNAIVPLYDNTNAHLIGWAKIVYLGKDYSEDGYGKISASLVENINNSPSIKKMLQAPEQLILMGDSILGYPQENSMPDILRGITETRVWNIACGGCTMALRSMSYYDEFSFTTLIDSLVSKNFTSQEAAISNRGSEPDFSVQLQNCKQIDLSLPTVIVCNYINNDLTTNVPIGTLWEYTNTIDSYNKNTFCGAQNYGVQKLLAAYPHIKIIFLTDSYRWRQQAGSGVSVPPYLYHNKNNDTAEKYVQAEKDNCKRLGIKCYDFWNYGVRNAFAMDYSTTDGTHCNPYGFQELAKYIHNIYKNAK